eukprot:7030322-Pyramimonas_sp.AAC.1
MPGLSVAVGHGDPTMGAFGTCPCCTSRLPCSARLPRGPGVGPTDGGAPPDLAAAGLTRKQGYGDFTTSG